jgi:hypothetical protein
MNRAEAETVIRILLRADNGCPSCTWELVQRFANAFPRYEDVAIQLYEAKIGQHADIKRSRTDDN